MDYGYTQSYMESQDMFDGIMQMGQVLNGFEDSQSFVKEMKSGLHMLKKTVNNTRPIFDMLKLVYSSLHRK